MDTAPARESLSCGVGAERPFPAPHGIRPAKVVRDVHGLSRLPCPLLGAVIFVDELRGADSPLVPILLDAEYGLCYHPIPLIFIPSRSEERAARKNSSPHSDIRAELP